MTKPTADESRALALVIHAHPEWTKQIRTSTDYEQLGSVIQTEAERAFQSYYGHAMNHDPVTT